MRGLSASKNGLVRFGAFLRGWVSAACWACGRERWGGPRRDQESGCTTQSWTGEFSGNLVGKVWGERLFTLWHEKFAEQLGVGVNGVVRVEHEIFTKMGFDPGFRERDGLVDEVV